MREKKEIRGLAKFSMIGGAIAIDAAEIYASIATVGGSSFLSGIIQYGLFFLWFRYYGCNFFYRRGKAGAKPKNPNVIRQGANKTPEIKDFLTFDWSVFWGLVLESIPLVEYLPIFTWNVCKTINAHNKSIEDNEAAQSNPTNPNTTRQSKKQDEPENKTGGATPPPLPKTGANVTRLKRT